MITLHILEWLKQNGVGTEIDKDLFFEKLPIDKTGIAIFSLGGSQAFGRNSIVQQFDLYSRGVDDVAGYVTLETIRELLADSYGKVCELPTVPEYTQNVYSNVRFMAIDNVENIGVDENERVVYRMSSQVIYNKGETI